MEAQEPRPIRVLYLDHVPRLSGAEQSLRDLVVGLCAGPVEPVVVLSGDGPLAAELRAAGVLVRMVPMSRRMLETSRRTLAARPFVAIARLGAFVAAGLRIWRLVREIRPRLIHTNTLKMHLIAILPARLSHTPLVWHVRDILPKGWVRRAFIFCARFPTVIIVPSRAVALGFGKRKRTIYRKLRLIPNGIPVQAYESRAAGKALRSELRVNGAPLVGIVGRIAPWKGHEVFVHAAAMVADRHPKARFAIIGGVLFPENDEPFARQLARLVADMRMEDRISFLGWRDPVQAVSALDVLVHASTEPEPFGRSLLEAMAVGIPVVAAAGGAVSEILPPAAGLIIPPGRPEILADALDALLADRRMRERMGRAGKAIAHHYFDVRRTVAAVGALYGEIAKAAPVRKERRPRRPSAIARRHRAEPRPGTGRVPKGRFRPGARSGALPIDPPLPDKIFRDPEPPVPGRGPIVPDRTVRRDPGPRSPRIRTVRRLPPAASGALPAASGALPAPSAAGAPPAASGAPPAAPAAGALRRAVPARASSARFRAASAAAYGGQAATARAVSPVPVPHPSPRRGGVAPVRPMPLGRPAKPVFDAVKRAMDVGASLALLVLGIPLWLAVAIAIKLDSPGPVLFRGIVYGKGCRRFTYYKFRSMRTDMSDEEHRRFIERYVREDSNAGGGETVCKLTGDPRVTRVGRLIRRLSVDEVPQLINVLRGDMSLVGPRPPLAYEYDLYDDWAKQRLAVRPGVTGLQQVRARHTASFKEKVEMDLSYIRGRSLALDLKILVKTIPAALAGE